MGIEWQTFREDKLWVPEVRLMFTMNDAHLHKLYAKYVNQGQISGKKDNRIEYMQL